MIVNISSVTSSPLFRSFVLEEFRLVHLTMGRALASMRGGGPKQPTGTPPKHQRGDATTVSIVWAAYWHVAGVAAVRPEPLVGKAE